jgi:hypothetical protein
MLYHGKIAPVSDYFSANSNSSMHLPQDSAVTSPCEGMHAGLISEEIITAGAAPRRKDPQIAIPEI